MVRKGFILTRNEAADLFLILSIAKIKLQGKVRTDANKYWEKFEDALDLKLGVTE